MAGMLMQRAWNEIVKHFKYQGPYSQHFFFILTYEQAQLVRGFVTGKPFQTNLM
jgi:hypothetical protein